MTRDELEKLIEEAANRFAETRDRRYQDEVVQLTIKLAELHNIEVLTRAVARCRDEDICTSEVTHALDFLQTRASAKWPFDQFRKALNNETEEGRCEMLRASLNGIRQAIGIV